MYVEPEIPSRGTFKALASAVNERSLLSRELSRVLISQIWQNPYWKTFNPYVEPLLERPMDLRRFDELEKEKE